ERAVGPDDPDHVLDPLPAIVQVVSVIRALAGGSVHAGPVVLERLDYATMAPRPVPALAARPCGTLTSKIDGTVARSLPTALRRLSSDPNGSAARALERYQFAATAPGLSALRAIVDSIVEIYADERDIDAAALRLATVIGSSLPERRVFLDAMRRSAITIRTAATPTETTAAGTRVLAAGLRATIAAALVGELPLGSLREYADGVLLGETGRKQLGVAAMRPSVDDES
ncbi:MAG: hypothetical protein H7123_07270, partial [Thermoleophilia bacterium]|nr:hypothetical protein [Thermoleophilia bacterium]